MKMNEPLMVAKSLFDTGWLDAATFEEVALLTKSGVAVEDPRWRKNLEAMKVGADSMFRASLRVYGGIESLCASSDEAGNYAAPPGPFFAENMIRIHSILSKHVN
jgi:hypothetical protein